MAKLKKLVFLVLFALVLIIGVVLGLRNKAETELDLIFDIVGPYPVSALIIGAFFVGIFTGYVISKLSQVTKKLSRKPQASASKEVTAVG